MRIARIRLLFVTVALGVAALAILVSGSGASGVRQNQAKLSPQAALVSLGKSPLAELTSVVASLWICVSCDLMPLIPLLVSPLTEFCRLVRSVQ